MHNVEERTGWDAIAKRARRIAMWRRKRRIERLDVLVASLLLLLLIFGWAMDFVRTQLWPGSNLLTASPWHHAWSLR
jgi:cell division septal protein FtsQ